MFRIFMIAATVLSLLLINPSDGDARCGSASGNRVGLFSTIRTNHANRVNARMSRVESRQYSRSVPAAPPMLNYNRVPQALPAGPSCPCPNCPGNPQMKSAPAKKVTGNTTVVKTAFLSTGESLPAADVGFVWVQTGCGRQNGVQGCYYRQVPTQAPQLQGPLAPQPQKSSSNDPFDA